MGLKEGEGEAIVLVTGGRVHALILDEDSIIWRRCVGAASGSILSGLWRYLLKLNIMFTAIPSFFQPAISK